MVIVVNSQNEKSEFSEERLRNYFLTQGYQPFLADEVVQRTIDWFDDEEKVEVSTTDLNNKVSEFLRITPGLDKELKNYRNFFRKGTLLKNFRDDIPTLQTSIDPGTIAKGAELIGKLGVDILKGGEEKRHGDKKEGGVTYPGPIGDDVPPTVVDITAEETGECCVKGVTKGVQIKLIIKARERDDWGWTGGIDEITIEATTPDCKRIVGGQGKKSGGGHIGTKTFSGNYCLPCLSIQKDEMGNYLGHITVTVTDKSGNATWANYAVPVSEEIVNQCCRGSS